MTLKKIYCTSLFFAWCISASGQTEKLIYHNIKTDAGWEYCTLVGQRTGKSMEPCYTIGLEFLDTMRLDINGIPYYMNHQVWWPRVNDARGIGGDQSLHRHCHRGNYYIHIPVTNKSGKT